MNPLDENTWLGSLVRRECSFGPDGLRHLHLADRFPRLALSQYNMSRGAAPRKKVCIVGGGLGREEAPLDSLEWEVWCINLCPCFDKSDSLRADRWFDLHQRKAQSPDDMRWLAQCPVPLYVPPDLADCSPNAVVFPLDEIERELAVSYWTCSFAYEIALVLHEGTATDLGLYGVELAFGSRRERTVEWACTAYWLGRAQERGLRIHTPTTSTLGRHSARYGFEYDQEKEAVERYTGSDHFRPLDELVQSNT